MTACSWISEGSIFDESFANLANLYVSIGCANLFNNVEVDVIFGIFKIVVPASARYFKLPGFVIWLLPGTNDNPLKIIPGVSFHVRFLRLFQ